VALLPLALLCLFTIGTGTAAARLLPARLALCQLPSVATRALAAPGPVVRAASGAVRGVTGRAPGAYADIPLFLFHLREYMDVDAECDVDEIN
jgi:hypothetical protein